MAWQASQGVHDYDPPDDTWTYTYEGASDPRGRLGGLVVIGDSYFDAMQRSGIDSYFSTVHRAATRAEKFSDIYAAIPPGTRYLVFEFIEVSLFGLSYHGLSVPAIK